MSDFLALFEEAIDGTVPDGMNTVLADVEEWDSFAFVNFCVLIDNAYRKQIRSVDLRAALTVNDLYELVQGTKPYAD